MKKAVIHTQTGVIVKLIDPDPDDTIIEPDGFSVVDIPQEYVFARPRVDKLVDGVIVEATDEDIDASKVEHPRKWAKIRALTERVALAHKAIVDRGATKQNLDAYFVALYDLDAAQ